MIRSMVETMRRKAQLKQEDELWREMGGPCFSLFPPSFYKTHTKEEIETATKETLAECRSLLEELK